MKTTDIQLQIPTLLAGVVEAARRGGQVAKRCGLGSVGRRGEAQCTLSQAGVSGGAMKILVRWLPEPDSNNSNGDRGS